jgi:hypothetical protein
MEFLMLEQLIKIADFLNNQSTEKKDALFIEYITEKYASGDINSFFDKKEYLDMPKEEREILKDVLLGLAKAFDKKKYK